MGMRLSDEKLPKLIIAETLLFLQRPSTKPSHRLYCLGFLNKFASIADSAETRSGLLQIYFGLFNKVLHTTEPSPMEAPKKDRSMSKKDRMKLKHKLRQRKACDVDEEDNKVIELVLKGINILLLKSSGDSSEL